MGVQFAAMHTCLHGMYARSAYRICLLGAAHAREVRTSLSERLPGIGYGGGQGLLAGIHFAEHLVQPQKCAIDAVSAPAAAGAGYQVQQKKHKHRVLPMLLIADHETNDRYAVMPHHAHQRHRDVWVKRFANMVFEIANMVFVIRIGAPLLIAPRPRGKHAVEPCLTTASYYCIQQG